MKRIITILALLTGAWLSLQAQELERISSDEMLLSEVSSLTDEQLDTINVKKALKINDYLMFGVQYGAGLSQVMWNPKVEQEMVFIPMNVGITFTKYQKMFGYMPYFGFQAGAFYTHEGYQFKYDEEDDFIYKIEGAEKAILEIVEVPMMFQFHYDMWNFKIMAQIGCYGGYRLSIQRFPGETGRVSESLKNSFTKTDNRWDYGIKGGLGFGLVFDPIEIHIQAMYKHSYSSLYTPDHYSEYYYRFAYPSNIVVSVGLHYQLTKRSGRTKAEIKQMARDMVYQNEINNGNSSDNSRKRNNRK